MFQLLDEIVQSDKRLTHTNVLHHLVSASLNDDLEWVSIKRIVKRLPHIDADLVNAIMRQFLRKGWIEGFPESNPVVFKANINLIEKGLMHGAKDPKNKDR